MGTLLTCDDLPPFTAPARDAAGGDDGKQSPSNLTRLVFEEPPDRADDDEA